MNPRVLVVDDDRFMVRTLSDVLRLRGWEVSQAYSGIEAVEMVSTDAFDVVLMDVKMPGMDGVATFKAMKARAPGIKVLLMTAYSAQELLQEAEREGVMRIVQKPVNLGSLLELLTASLAARCLILLVDTDATFLRTLSEVLSLKGFETVTARSVDEAEHLMSERRPRAVLLHLHLVHDDVGDTIAAMHDADPGASLILYSDQPNAEEDIPVELPREWIRAYLQKPFAVENITGVLDALSSS